MSRAWFRILPLLLAGLALAGEPSWQSADERVSEDRWYLGMLNGQPSVSLRLTTWQRGDGWQRGRMEMQMLIGRVLAGRDQRMAFGTVQDYLSGSDGRVAAFRIEEDQNGSRTLAEGAIAITATAAIVRSSVLRQGRRTPGRIVLPLTEAPLADQAAWQQLAGGATTARFTGIALLNGMVQAMRTTAAIRPLDDGFEAVLTPDLMPIPLTVELDRQGVLRRMQMQFGGLMRLDLKPVDAPPALRAAGLDAGQLVRLAGPPPRPGDRTVFLLPAGAQVPSDEFQQISGTRAVVTSRSAAGAPADPAPLLRAEAQLELDDPELRTWVAAQAAGTATGSAAQAERLRQAVRAHITTKDLSQGDASALETFRSRRGDCTEHANLLAAALRIAGIPARVEVGIVYAPELGGFGGHAWVSAFAGGAWQHLDAAYPGIPRAHYLRLGSPGEGQAGAAMMGNLHRLAGREIRVEGDGPGR